ncbi:MAG: AMP-dependent synthetase [Verrucomicrobia bacterium TMED56]|jgi:long-chain acyl-CoA synthetase|nr:MAG: AMP-dependent synthetase [Verrucomicrobia bacterium TMED56]
MRLIEKLTKKWGNAADPFLIHPSGQLSFSEVSKQKPVDLSNVKQGDVVALIGDFDPVSILSLLSLIDLGAILVPLTVETREDHEYFFETALVDFVIEGRTVRRLDQKETHPIINELRRRRNAGLVLFSTGTTGRPKAILHDFSYFLKRFDTPRPTLRTLNFLLFDHIGGINTLLHTLFNKGVVIAPHERSVEGILSTCEKYQVEVLPTTPTFLRMLLISGFIPKRVPMSLKIITYGTERMDQPTLDQLCTLLPEVDFRQTFGMSELGIVRVKSESRSSLFMKVGGEGVETRIVNGILQIRSANRMLGYLNAPSPFSQDGWYDTKDVVEEKNGLYKVIGRTSEVINVGGLKFMASELERVALLYDGLSLVKAYGKDNPITGQHAEIIVQPKRYEEFDKNEFKKHMQNHLQNHMTPRKIRVEKVAVGHRHKRS